MPSHSPSPKPRRVVSIPVHFVGSERTRSDSAIKIQKALRGFLVRKNMKKIAAVRSEVRGIETRLSKPDAVDSIKRDAKESLKLSETLMNLLLRLDSVTTVDFGVRSCRKSVIKRAIALQEKLDRIVSDPDDQTEDQRDDVEVEEEDADDVSQTQSLALPVDEAYEITHAEIVDAGITDECDPLANPPESNEHVETIPASVLFPDVACQNPSVEPVMPTPAPPLENEEKMVTVAEEFANYDFYPPFFGMSNSSEQSGTSSAADDGETRGLMEEDEEVDSSQKHEEETESGSRELLKKMMEDNEKMMGLMAQLFERNDKQTILLSSLSHRVGQLEKAYACDKLRKKKRRNFVAAADGLDNKSSGNKKCDKKN